MMFKCFYSHIASFFIMHWALRSHMLPSRVLLTLPSLLTFLAFLLAIPLPLCIKVIMLVKVFFVSVHQLLC